MIAARVLPGMTLVLAVLATGFPRPALAGRELPIQGGVEGSVQATPIQGTESHYRLDNLGTGTISHLGRVEAIWAVPEVILDLENRTVTVANLEWHGRIKAANGDEILGEYTFPVDTIPFSITGGIEFTAELVITGGTGRFEGASGRAAVRGEANIFTRTFEIQLEGTITPGR